MKSFLIPSRRKTGFHIDVVPLIDVVFVILIFNIMSSTLTQQTGVDVDKPQAQSAGAGNRFIHVTAGPVYPLVEQIVALP